ncbi:hypothetical protein X801_07525 [Opisthorchis viverrini]|uniref:Peptidase S1 domain-containing protein n=1 Tax=Opisthorchis viverrini TaxID=6198 RepID=A0A1S8WQ61_OPIVI|nr:hypothetical protein X801_07525 [Opisthorchis viverrini]
MWEGKGICVGDSGGALVCPGGGKVIMAGIGIGSQTESPGNYPSVFTRVSDYIDWIRSVIDQHPTS